MTRPCTISRLRDGKWVPIRLAAKGVGFMVLPPRQPPDDGFARLYGGHVESERSLPGVAMRIVCISDTHQEHQRLRVPDV